MSGASGFIQNKCTRIIEIEKEHRNSDGISMALNQQMTKLYKKNVAASSMQHEAKIAYYAFDVTRFFVPYAARLKLRGRVAR